MNEELQFKTITFLRFPLIVCVVFIHAQFPTISINGLPQLETFPLYSVVSFFFSTVLAQIAVPLYFFISGFLFFYKIDFSFANYKKKIKNRIRSILVPYLFWNTFVLIAFYFASLFIPEMFSGENKAISTYTIFDFINAFWACNSDGTPICYQLWFIRDLMVLMLFSPIIYAIVSCFKGLGVVLLGVLWFCNYWFAVEGFSIAGFFFFSLGAWFSVHKCAFINNTRSLLILFSALYSLISLLEICLFILQETWGRTYIRSLNILVGIVFALSVSSYFLEKNKSSGNVYLSNSSFFVYAFHGIPLAFLGKFLIHTICPQNDFILLLIFFFDVIFILFIGVSLYQILRKVCPRFINIIAGGR